VLAVPASSALGCEDEDERTEHDEDDEDDDDDGEERDVEVDLEGPHALLTWRDRRIGVQPLELTPELREHFGAPAGSGVMIARVDRGGPADKAGIKVGDIIVRAGGENLAEVADLVKVISKRQPGQTISVELVRDGDSEEVEVRVEPGKVTRIFQRMKEHELRARARATERFHERMQRLRERLEELEERLEER
jgi:predicted metalloprotease with PDZ domain